jgi:hypothetical protein
MGTITWYAWKMMSRALKALASSSPILKAGREAGEKSDA